MVSATVHTASRWRPVQLQEKMVVAGDFAQETACSSQSVHHQAHRKAVQVPVVREADTHPWVLALIMLTLKCKAKLQGEMKGQIDK